MNGEGLVWLFLCFRGRACRKGANNQAATDSVKSNRRKRAERSGGCGEARRGRA